MPRFSRIGLGSLFVLLVGIGLWWIITPEDPPPSASPVERLSDTTTIRWTEEGLAVIDASGSLDALTALGYVHGLNRGWTVALWRQTALGTLSRWFGTGVAPLDRHARQLGLSHQAQAAYDELPAADKQRFRAYSRGLNAALQSDRVQNQDPFVLLGVQPRPWEPWHTLAVERLLAWLATPPLDPSSEAPSAVTDFRQVDQLFRRWLHLHGWHRSVAWAVRARPSTGPPQTVLFQRHVLGASASPLVQEVTLSRPSASRLTGATLPGVPIFFTGTTAERAWASLLRSPARLDRTPLDSTALAHRHERITPSNGDEQLVRIQRLNGNLLLGHTASPDSVAGASALPGRSPPLTAWVLRWPGFSAASDLPAWLRRAGLPSSQTDTTSFQLFDADGLRVSAQGTWSVTGSPAVVVRDEAREHVIAGQSKWAQHQAQSFRAHHRSSEPPNVSRWSASDSSTWAARLLSSLQPALDRFSRTHPQFQTVVTYLRNWDHTYDPSSIGATLFDQWMRFYRQDLGHVPTPADSTAYFASYRQQRALRRALDTLQARFGPDVRQWRWERTVPDRRYFPVWSADSLVNGNLQELNTTQYAPLSYSGRGHPSALSGGRSLVDPPPTAASPAAWSGWATPADSTLVVRRRHYDPTVIFARSRMQRTRPPPISLSPNNASHTTTLVPAPR